MDDDNHSAGAKIIAFLITLVALPFLFAVTCMPVGLFAAQTRVAAYVIGTYCVAFVIGAGIIAFRTDNPGMRWGIVVSTIAMVGFALYFLSQF